MRVIFEDDDGTRVILALPRVDLRKSYQEAKDLPWFFGLDPQQEILSGLALELCVGIYPEVMREPERGPYTPAALADAPPFGIFYPALLHEICKQLVESTAGESAMFLDKRGSK